MKMAGTGATFPSTPGAQRVLETSLTTWDTKIAKYSVAILNI
jgi:hypothetical protein